MKKNKTTISNASDIFEIADFWDKHSLSDYWDQIQEVHFDVNIKSRQYVIEFDSETSKTIKQNAKKRGISNTALISEWVRDRARKSKPKSKITQSPK